MSNVEIQDNNLVRVYADFSRKLHIVDPDARGLYISLGAFIENFYLAAGSLGPGTEISLFPDQGNNSLVAEIKLSPAESTGFHLEKIENRRTLRIPFKKDALSEDHIYSLIGINAEKAFFFPAGSEKGRYLSAKTLQAYTLQAND